MRWLLLKDLQILRRSPLLVALLIIYPVLVALLIGYALSRGLPENSSSPSASTSTRSAKRSASATLWVA